MLKLSQYFQRFTIDMILLDGHPHDELPTNLYFHHSFLLDRRHMIKCSLTLLIFTTLCLFCQNVSTYYSKQYGMFGSWTKRLFVKKCTPGLMLLNFGMSGWQSFNNPRGIIFRRPMGDSSERILCRSVHSFPYVNNQMVLSIISYIYISQNKLEINETTDTTLSASYLHIVSYKNKANFFGAY